MSLMPMRPNNPFQNSYVQHTGLLPKNPILLTDALMRPRPPFLIQRPGGSVSSPAEREDQRELYRRQQPQPFQPQPAPPQQVFGQVEEQPQFNQQGMQQMMQMMQQIMQMFSMMSGQGGFGGGFNQRPPMFGGGFGGGMGGIFGGGFMNQGPYGGGFGQGGYQQFQQPQQRPMPRPMPNMFGNRGRRQFEMQYGFDGKPRGMGLPTNMRTFM